MYRWVVLIHILGVSGFLLAHGVSVGVALKLRGELQRDRIRTLLEFSASSLKLFYASLGLLLVGGIWAGFIGQWWSQGWIWWSLVILLVTMGGMYALAMPYYRRLNRAVQMRPSGNPAVSDEELVYLLRSGRGILVAAIGFAGLIAIVFMMVVKPF